MHRAVFIEAIYRIFSDPPRAGFFMAASNSLMLSDTFRNWGGFAAAAYSAGAAQFITTGDALSQLVGRWIPCRYNGEWHRYTRSANESISGASDWHREEGRWSWPAQTIDAVFRIFGSDDHCATARVQDLQRAKELCEANGYTVN